MCLNRQLKTLGFAAGLACFAAAATSQEAQPLFETHEVATPPALHQTVLTGSFDGTGRAQLAVVRVDPGGARHVQFLLFDGNEWASTVEHELGMGVLFVDVATVAGRDRLLTYRDDAGIGWLEPVTGATHPVVDVIIRYRSSENKGIPRLDIARDLNGDGHDDVLLPDLDGFWVSIQSLHGTFAAPRKLGPPEPFLDATLVEYRQTYREIGITSQTLPWYLSRVHRMDYDRDGRDDIAFWNGDHFLFYRQNETGGFEDAPRTFSVDFSFDFDAAYGLAFQFPDASLASMLLGLRPRTEHTALYAFRDLNGDGVSDAVTLSLAGRSPFRMRGRYDVRFGRPTPGGTSFPASADTCVEAPGRSGGLQPWGYASQRFLDLDGDGLTDMAMGAVNTRPGGMFRATVGNSITMDLALHTLRNDEYSAKPDWNRRVRSPFSPLDRRGPLFPTVLTGDIDGDGRADLLVGERWNELRVFLGTPGRRLLAEGPIAVPVAIPADERTTMLSDLDGNGKADVVIQHPATSDPGRLTLLMAR